MSEKEKGYENKPMYDDSYDGMPTWEPPSDWSETARRHRNRIDRIKRDENTR